MANDQRLRDLRVLGLHADPDDAEVLEAYNRRRALYEADNLAIYNLHSEEARLQLLADLEAALNRLTEAPRPMKARQKTTAPAAHRPEPPAGPEPDREMSPGGFLRYHRLARGLSLTEVARETKIGEARLEAIESEKSADLPAVYARGFVVTLANLLALPDPGGLARAYLNRIGNTSGEGQQG